MIKFAKILLIFVLTFLFIAWSALFLGAVMNGACDYAFSNQAEHLLCGAKHLPIWLVTLLGYAALVRYIFVHK